MNQQQSRLNAFKSLLKRIYGTPVIDAITEEVGNSLRLLKNKDLVNCI